MAATHKNLVFVKLGGSLITAKERSHTPRPETIERLADEIASALRQKPALSILLGHGSGSFGHVPAQRYGTRHGVSGADAWRGFAEVWHEAAALNHLVLDALHRAGLPALAFPPSASVLAHEGKPATWDLGALLSSLEAGLLPVVYGDVVFDSMRGGTILSTEELFSYLAGELLPECILLAGIEPGVWRDYPARENLVDALTPTSFADLKQTVAGAQAVDVTGGMLSKVEQSLELVKRYPALEVLIFSGEQPGALLQALLGGRIGTSLHAER